MHVAATVALNELPISEHPVPVTVKVRAPMPDPPVAVSGMTVPTEPVSVVFTTLSVAWGPVNAKIFAQLVAAR